jgi:hypothetical protein
MLIKLEDIMLQSPIFITSHNKMYSSPTPINPKLTFGKAVPILSSLLMWQTKSLSPITKMEYFVAVPRTKKYFLSTWQLLAQAQRPFWIHQNWESFPKFNQLPWTQKQKQLELAQSMVAPTSQKC